MSLTLAHSAAWSDAAAAAVREERLLRGELVHALRNGEFVLEYQPIFRMGTRDMNHVEALLRWNNPRLGRVAPDRFINALEAMHLIGTVGEWVLRTACEQVSAWRRQGIDLRVAVNVSVHQLELADFETRVAAILAETACPADRIELEITESVLGNDVPGQSARLRRLAALGLRIAMDDFGAGHSNLGRLADLPIQHIKLDRAMISRLPGDAKDAVIVNAVVALARALGMELTIEGVETAGQQHFFAGHPGINAQGYLLARPMAADGVARICHEHAGVALRATA